MRSVGFPVADVASAPRGRRSDEATERRTDEGGGRGSRRADVGAGREGEPPAEPRTYTFSPLGTVAQELVVKGGFEAVIRDQLAKLAQLASRVQQLPLPSTKGFRKLDNILLLLEAHFRISGNRA